MTGRSQSNGRDQSDAEFRDKPEAPRRDYAPEGVAAESGWWPTLKRTATVGDQMITRIAGALRLNRITAVT